MLHQVAIRYIFNLKIEYIETNGQWLVSINNYQQGFSVNGTAFTLQKALEDFSKNFEKEKNRLFIENMKTSNLIETRRD